MATPRGLREAVEDLGLQRALGFVRMLRLSADDPLNYPEVDPPQPHPPVDLADLRCSSCRMLQSLLTEPIAHQDRQVAHGAYMAFRGD